MFKSRLPAALFAFLFLIPMAAGPAGAAEFDIDAQRTVLRRLQYCSDCGAALLVTRVHAGVKVRCPDCGREQPRLANQYLLTQVYQLCRVCEAPLDPAGRHPGETVECDNCHTRQILSRDAFPSGDDVHGLGYVPGLPPGSGKKTLLFSPETPTARITPVPLDDDADPPETNAYAATGIPRPPLPPPVLELPVAPQIAPRTDEPSPALPTPQVSDALEVPAVTVDMFGGRRSAATDKAPGFIPSGDVVARVDGAPIYAADVGRVLEPIMQRLREKAGPDADAVLAGREAELRQEILERLIDRELAVREAGRLGHRPDAAAVRAREAELASIMAATGADLRREAERDVIMADMRARFAEKPGAANPEAVREFYRRHKDEMQHPRLLALSQLVIYQNRVDQRDRRDYQEIAAEVARELEQGRRFDDLRSRYDEFLPLAGLAYADPPLQPESAFASQILLDSGDLRRGAVFGPLFMEGMALFGKVVDERAGGPAPFEEVEKEIRRRLEGESAEKSLDAWLRQLRHKAKVETFIR